MQGAKPDFSDTHSDVLRWVARSAQAGRKWVVAVDEPGDASHAIRPDADAGQSHENGRRNALWATLMAGGAGNEWYFGYKHAHSDLTLQDYRSRDRWWDYPRYAREFFVENAIPFWRMQNVDAVTNSRDDYVLAAPGEVYVVYLKQGGPCEINLPVQPNGYDLHWFNPRQGGPLQQGAVTMMNGGPSATTGDPPNTPQQDWALLIRQREPSG